MAKRWQDRITETITYIQALNGPGNLQYGNPIAEKIRLMHIGNRLQVISEQMSQGSLGVRQRDTQRTFRQQRRALILVRSTLGNSTAQAAALYANGLHDAAVLGQLDTSMGQVVTQARAALLPQWQSLITNPATFLQNNKIYVDSSPVHGATQYGFYFNDLDQRFNLNSTPPGNQITLPVNVFHIHVQPWPTVVGNLGNIASSRVDVDIAITTQLTGCAYLHHVDGQGDLYAAHIWPQKAIDAVVMAGNLRNNTGLQPLGAAPTVFGAGPNNNTTEYTHQTHYTYAVAVKVGGTWGIHCQQQVKGAPLGAPLIYRRLL